MKDGQSRAMEVWQEIRKDQERGAVRLVSEFGDRLYAAAFLLCRNAHDAEELTFRTFDQAVKKIALYDPERSFFTWLYAIALNFRRMDLRRRRAEVLPMGAPTELPEVPHDAFAEILERSGGDEVVAAVGRLPKEQRETVVLRYFDDCPLDVIAETLGVPLGTVKSRLHIARAALYESLKSLMERR